MARLEGPAPAGAGDVAVGEALFVGSRPLAEGGAPCAACHAVGGRGAPLAATFGPDLTDAFPRLGKDVLEDVLAAQPFPSMSPIYASHPVTPAERADLVAFLASAGAASPAAGGGAFALHAGGVAAFLFALLWLRRRRNGSARAELIAQASKGGHR